MPISLDEFNKCSNKELKNMLISTYEDKLRSMLILDNYSLSMILKNSRFKSSNYPYIYMHIKYPNKSCIILYDRKNDVPVIEIYNPTHYQFFTAKAFMSINSEKRSDTLFLTSQKFHTVELIYIERKEMFSTVMIPFQYNNCEMVKTYKRYIKLRGE